MPRFEGCVEAKEISLTRKGANQHAKVLVRKNLVGAADPQSQLETPEMTTASAAEIQKAALAIGVSIAKMNDVTKSYFLGLADDVQTTFLEKSADDQRKEAEAAKAEADRKAAEAEAAKSGVTVREQELQKTLDTQATQIADLQKRLADQDIEKRAASEFDGYPGGVVELVPLLKAYATLPEAARIASENLLKAQAKLAKESTKALGGRTEEQVSKAAAAKTRIDEAAKALAAEKKISFGDAFVEVIEKREFADDVALMSGEAA